MVTERKIKMKLEQSLQALRKAGFICDVTESCDSGMKIIDVTKESIGQTLVDDHGGPFGFNPANGLSQFENADQLVSYANTTVEIRLNQINSDDDEFGDL